MIYDTLCQLFTVCFTVDGAVYYEKKSRDILCTIGTSYTIDCLGWRIVLEYYVFL